MGNDYDPLVMGQVLARLDSQDKMLADLKEDVGTIMECVHRKAGMHKVLMGIVTVAAFVLGNAIQWIIFRGPGAH